MICPIPGQSHSGTLLSADLGFVLAEKMPLVTAPQKYCTHVAISEAPVLMFYWYIYVHAYILMSIYKYIQSILFTCRERERDITYVWNV